MKWSSLAPGFAITAGVVLVGSLASNHPTYAIVAAVLIGTAIFAFLIVTERERQEKIAAWRPAAGQSIVTVLNTGRNKIGCIKALREVRPYLGLREAKDLVDAPANSPRVIARDISEELADRMRHHLEQAGFAVVVS